MALLSIPAFAGFITEMIAEIDHVKHHMLKEGAKIIETEAKRVIGTYDYGWPQLAPSTQEDRGRQGFSDNEPLLRTGNMRDSINTVIEGHEAAYIGSNDMIAVYQELGTATIPPRSFLAGAAVHKEQEIADRFGDITVKTFANGRFIP